MIMVNKPLVEKLREWETVEVPFTVKRDLEVNIGLDIVAIVGPRRVGKTYFMLDKINQLRENGKKPLFIDFEDLHFKGYGLDEIIEAQREITPLSDHSYIFLDEIHNLRDWGSHLRTLHNSGKFRIMITGSSSRLLLKEISSNLRGRYISKLLIPFSYPEYLRLKHGPGEPDTKGDIQEYMDLGGYPEVIKLYNDMEKQEKLKSIYYTTLYRDIIERFNVKEKEVLEFILNYMISNTGNTVTISKLHKVIRSNLTNVSKRTVWKYYNFVLDSLSVFEVLSLTYSKKKETQLPRKIYAVDTGLVRTVSLRPDLGRMLETLVYLDLLRRTNTEDIEIRYLPLDDHEIDFAVLSKGTVKELIQVCYDVSDHHTLQRESDALVKGSKKTGCRDLKIITFDKEASIEIGKGKISLIPIRDYLLRSR